LADKHPEILDKIKQVPKVKAALDAFVAEVGEELVPSPSLGETITGSDGAGQLGGMMLSPLGASLITTTAGKALIAALGGGLLPSLGIATAGAAGAIAVGIAIDALREKRMDNKTKGFH